VLRHLHAPQCATQVFLFIRIYLRPVEIRRIEAFRGSHFGIAPTKTANPRSFSIRASTIGNRLKKVDNCAVFPATAGAALRNKLYFEPAADRWHERRNAMHTNRV